MEYTPGDLVVVAGLDLVVVLAPREAVAALVRRLWIRVSEPLDARVPLSAVVGPSSPIDLTGVDDVAVVRSGDRGVEAVLKGSLQLSAGDVGVDDGPVAALRRAWREQTSEGPGPVVLAHSHRTFRDTGWLPLRIGVVRAAAVRWSSDEATRSSVIELPDPHRERGQDTHDAPGAASRVDDHSVSHRLLFGSQPRSAMLDPRREGEPATETDRSRQPNASTPQATLLPPELTSVGKPSEHDRPPSAVPVGETSVSPPAVGVSVAQPVPGDPSILDSPRPPERDRSAPMLPRMPEGWVHRRNGRRGAGPSPDHGLGPDRDTDHSAGPSQPRTGRGPAFLTRIATPHHIPDGTDAPIGNGRPGSSPGPDHRSALVDPLPAGGLPSALRPVPPIPVPPDQSPMQVPKADAEVVQATVHAALAPPADDGHLFAVSCPSRHLNPPEATSCRVCGRPVTPRQPVRVHRPQLGRLCRPGLPDLPVAGPMILGRRPEWHGPGPSPQLVTVHDPVQNISRSHVSVSVSGWDVAVTDLGSSNGTRLELPNGQNRALVPHRPITIVPSTIIVLADILKIWFQVP